MLPKKFLIILLLYINIIFTSCFKDQIDLELNLVKRGSLKNEEYDYYILTLPDNIESENHLIIELEPNPSLDAINNIISDPNLYISTSEKRPSMNDNMWKSERFGDEIISINPSYLAPKKDFYIAVHCKSKCNYVLKAQLTKDLILKNDQMNVFTIKPKTVTKFSFKTKNKNFNELYVNIIGTFINSFKAYLAKENPSSSNTLKAEPIFFNGYRFTIKNDENIINNNEEYNLIVDNENEVEEINIWLQYDNENMLIKETDILYDSIEKNKAHCYYFPIDNINSNKDIIISSILFNGQGFIYVSGYKEAYPDSIKISHKKKEFSYPLIQNKAIKLNKNDLKNLEKFGLNEDKNKKLNFCFFAENNSSFSLKIYFLENYKKYQALNILYPGIGVQDIIPKKALKKYKLESFKIEEDIIMYTEKKTGTHKLYLYMAKPEEDQNFISEKKNFEILKSNGQILDANTYADTSYLYITKQNNKCTKNTITGKYKCILNAVIECLSEVDCTYYIFFDHTKKTTIMKPKIIYTNVISQNEEDLYKITITDPGIKNIAVVLMQNSGQTLLRCDNYVTERNVYQLKEAQQNDHFLPNLIKISTSLFKTEKLIGTFNIRVKGLSYGSYSLYYYTFNEEENEDQLDQDKVTMKLEKGKIIRDIFMDNHKFKVYMYDSSSNNEKSNLYIGLVETDNTNLELYIFKDLNDFYINKDTIHGYLWKGGYNDYVYIDKKDKKYIENDILYIMIYKSKKYFSSSSAKDSYTSFYLGLTDETTPLLLSEGIEFKHRLRKEHKSQKFNYYYVINNKSGQEEKQNLQISLVLYFGHIIAKISIENNFYINQYLKDEINLITVKNNDIIKYCKNKDTCGIEIEISNDETYLSFSSFLIGIKNEFNSPLLLKPGIINKRSILSGEEQHFIFDLKPEKYGTKITAYFINGYGELYARRLLRSEMFQKNEDYHFPDKDYYEYSTTKKNDDFYIIEIPTADFENHSHYRILLTVKGLSPNYLSTQITYTISISNSMTEISIDKNYKMFISQGEITFFHFKVENNKKRLYISMTEKDKDAKMFLSYDKYINNIKEYDWYNVGAFNEYIDISISDPFFVQRGMSFIDGDYFLAIEGKEDTFYNLYISSQDVKIITLEDNRPAACTCESSNDNCYFRYENLKSPSIKNMYEKKIIFYPEFTYGSGNMYAKLYKSGNMDNIMKNLPNAKNNDALNEISDQFIFMKLDETNPKFTFNSVIVVVMQCSEKSLFDLSATLLDKNTDVTRNTRDSILLKTNKDNIFYLSGATGLTSKFNFYIYKNLDVNFQIKTLLGKINVHSYTNSTSLFQKNKNNYHHIADFTLGPDDKNMKNEYYGKVPKEFGYEQFIFFEIKPEFESLINININYNEPLKQIPLNKETIATITDFNCYAYYEFNVDIDEVLITITSLDKNYLYNVYIKTNLILSLPEEISKDANKTKKWNQEAYSKPSRYNFDLQGTTNPLTSSLSLRVKNIPKNLRYTIRGVVVLINVESSYYANNKKVKMFVSPVVNNALRMKPEQSKYYFSKIEEKYSEKVIFNLKNTNNENDLMIIEVSSCKGNFIYALTDYPPLEHENYKSLKSKSIPSEIYSSNGKQIITVRNIQVKDYYLVLFGGREANVFDIIVNDKYKQEANKGNDEYVPNGVDVLFFYYTTNEKNYNYIVTQDTIKYESKDDFYSINFILPETKKRDIFGRENSAESMDYSFVITDERYDFDYMESTCYLAKLQQSNKKYGKIEIKFDNKKKLFKVNGLEGGKEYYMNILARNLKTGEIFTYKPVKIVASLTARRVKIILTVFLVIILIVFLYIAYTVYRKYKIKKMELNYVEDQNISSPKNKNKKIGKLKNINLDFVKKKYNKLGEDSQELNA